ncbi:MAG TPA: trypsin-like serine protease [Candidatus Limnocylindrales bacterium]|nr:trypsin-like serine protease [Candidatus Limnocylindrales bacterium]
MRKPLSIAVALLATLALAAPVAAITNGSPDAGEHPYVGELLFYVPDVPSSRFTDPGGWFTCSGTLLSPTIVVTAGHCTFGVGLNSVSTTHNGADTDAAHGGVGGNDVWISFAEVPDFNILPPSSTFTTQAARYAAWSSALNGSSEWHRATATPHPLYDDLAFFVHDAGVLRLGSPVTMPTYGHVPTVDYLNRYRSQPRNEHRFETVGYGLEQVQGKKAFGGDTRMQSHPKLDSLTSHPADTYMVLSNNTATGGTCFGDSGGPTFDDTSSNLVVAVTSWGQSPNCGGKGGVYRLDQPDDQAFLAGFGITP